MPSVRRMIADARRSGQSTLDLSRQNLSVFPDALRGLTQLTSLDLSVNGLTALPEWIGELTGLTRLNLYGNRIGSLPESIGRLEHLTVLNLGDNQLTSLPSSIGKLASLTRLDLDMNRLTALPGSIGRLTRLGCRDRRRARPRRAPAPESPVEQPGQGTALPLRPEVPSGPAAAHGEVRPLLSHRRSRRPAAEQPHRAARRRGPAAAGGGLGRVRPASAPGFAAVRVPRHQGRQGRPRGPGAPAHRALAPPLPRARALRGQRPLAQRLRHPAGLPFARHGPPGGSAAPRHGQGRLPGAVPPRVHPGPRGVRRCALARLPAQAARALRQRVRGPRTVPERPVRPGAAPQPPQHREEDRRVPPLLGGHADRQAHPPPARGRGRGGRGRPRAAAGHADGDRRRTRARRAGVPGGPVERGRAVDPHTGGDPEADPAALRRGGERAAVLHGGAAGPAVVAPEAHAHRGSRRPLVRAFAPAAVRPRRRPAQRGLPDRRAPGLAGAIRAAEGNPGWVGDGQSGAELRRLHSYLKRVDPGFGGLERVQDRGRYLWVHRDFVSEYEPGPPSFAGTARPDPDR